MSEKNFLITLMLPSYNKEKYAKRWVEGIAKQTFLHKTKLVVIDDCSTDGSYEKLKRLFHKHRLTADFSQNEKNMGLMYSTMKFYRSINTKYWCLLDADDCYISSRKIEKAVNFLETHEDYSAYACNQIAEYANGEKHILFSADIPSQTFTNLGKSLFFQTASIIFRNNFTPKLLDVIEEWSKSQEGGAFSADAFRWTLAFQFGKIYFENSPDSLWLTDIGAWGALSPMEQNLSNMNAYKTFFRFFKENFGLNDNTVACLNWYVQYYLDVCNQVNAMLRGLIADQFKFKNSSADSDDLGKIFDNLKECCKDLREIMDSNKIPL